jgi:sarcosine oxidase subunit beta
MMAGFRLPVVEVWRCRRWCLEPIKPAWILSLLTFAAVVPDPTKGVVISGGTDEVAVPRGSFHHVEEAMQALSGFPTLSRLKMLRQWGGIVDVTGIVHYLGPKPVELATALGHSGRFKAIQDQGLQ